MKLEGIVSKRKASAYRSGPTRDWLKIKKATWRAANRDRRELQLMTSGAQETVSRDRS